MSWVSKTFKKATNSVKKHLGSHWYLPGYAAMKGMGELSGGAYDEYKRNEGMYNRMALIMAGSILTGGALGAAAGAAGLGGATATTGAVAGAMNGAMSGAVAAGTGAYMEHEANKAAAEQERIQKEAEERQARLALQQAAQTPTEVSEVKQERRKQMQSQFRQTQVSRNKKLGGSTSTLA